MLAQLGAAGAIAVMSVTGATAPAADAAPSTHVTTAERTIVLPRPLPAGAVGPFYSYQQCEQDRALHGGWATTTPCFMYFPHNPWLGLPQWYYVKK